MKIACVGLAAAFAAGCTIAGLSYSSPATAAPAPSLSAPFSVDAGHSSVVFKIKHNDVAWFYGRFNTMSGSFSVDPANPEAGSVEVSVQAESVDTGNKKRDDHLRSPDFFSVKEFPEITFKSTSIRKTGDNAFEAVGDLTLHGVTKQITAPIEFTGKAEGRRGQLAGIHSSLTFKRSDFGMNFMVGGGLGDEVTIFVSLEGRGG